MEYPLNEILKLLFKIETQFKSNSEPESVRICGKIWVDKFSHVFDIFAELNEKIVEELPVEIFAHLIENEPVTDRAVRDEALDQIQVLTSLEISEMKVEVLPFKNCNVSLFAICFLKLTLWSFFKECWQ